ncbi:MAG: gliding motility-associated C-terminal domain-containing protein [Bacteroidia bacterium]|nr:gliding motility-associated C-terminal domain-containing protein [Bacteroidia bacterium]
MKRFFVLLCCFYILRSQDNCNVAASLPVNAGCVFTSGNTTGATQSFAGCVGTADDDVWYSFVANATSHSITVQGSASFDAVFEVFSGNCSGLTSLGCIDNTFNGGIESGIFSGLTIGQTYYIRVYHYFAGSGSGSFSICVSQSPTPPSNNNCGNAINLTVNNTCVLTAGTSFAATQSFSGCAGNANDDVWFTFTATNYTHLIQVVPNSTLDPVFQLYSGSNCSSLNSMNCVDNAFTGGTETLVATGLLPGSVYYIRVYDYYSNPGGTFSICVSGPSAGPSQPNDNPCSAIPLPPVTSNCNYLTFSNIGATQTPTTLAPAPFSCAGGSPPQTGGFSSSTKDVWFSIVVPSNGNIYITPRPNMGTGWITDGVMALYIGSCSSLTQIACSDDHTAYPGTANDMLPYIAATGLTPGSTVYLRYWGFSASQGSFGICVQSPTNDNCSNALYICDLNGYAASTSAAYTPDRPSNMRGNAEQPVTYAYTPGTNTGGIFGQGGPWGSGSPFFDVQINNNSWVMFTAATSTASFKVDIANCWVGNYPSGGLQMQIFSAQGPCNTFTPTSDFKEGSSTFTINAVNLTTGNNYYLMIDGFAGDICNYTITALTGVSFPGIASPKDSICAGQSITLSGPAGASSYTWLPGNINTPTLNVTPGTTQTYTLIAGGVCGYKQYLTKTIYVKSNPTVQINSGNSVTVCAGSTTTLVASGANNYTWSTGHTGPSIVVSPPSNAVYTVVGSTQGCTASATKVVTVHPTPTINVSASATNICLGNSATLNASGGISYTWQPGNLTGPSIVISPTTSMVYTVTGSNTLSCTHSRTLQINTLNNPTVTVNSATICQGQSANLTANGAVSYSWNTNQTSQSINVSPASTTQYTVEGTGSNGCKSIAVSTVQVRPLPNVTVTSGTLCSGQNFTLLAGGALSYTWNNLVTGNIQIVSPTANTSYTLVGTGTNGCNNTTVANLQVFQPPQLSSTPSIFPSNCSSSTGSITNISISGSSPFTYTWTNTLSQTVSNSPNLVNQPAGTYNLFVKDNNGCISQFGPFNIVNPNAPPAPTVSVNANQLCAGQTILLSAAGSGSGLTYNWSGPGGFNSNLQNPSIPNAGTGNSGVYSVFTTSAGCSGPAGQVTVIVHPLPNPAASSSQSVYCQPQTIQLFVTSASSYTWSGPGGFSSNQQNPVINNASPSSSGLYQVVVSNSAGCTNTATLQITVNPQPTPVVSAGAGTVCEGSNLVLQSAGGNSYIWQGPNGYLSTLQNPTLAPVSMTNSGIYTLTATNAFNCQGAQTVQLTVFALPSVTITNSQPSVCIGGQLTLTGNSNPSSVSYTWSGPGNISSNQQTLNVSPFQNNNIGIYTLQVLSNQGCINQNTINVMSYPVPSLNLQVSTQTVCSGQPVSMSASGAINYTWTGPSGFQSTLTTVVFNQIQNSQSGTFTVTGQDINGCIGQQTLSLPVISTPTLSNIKGDTTCIGRNLILTASFSPVSSVNWFADPGLNQLLASNSNSFQPTLNANGTYTYYVQANNAGCSSSVFPVVAQFYQMLLLTSAQPTIGAAPLQVSFSSTISSGSSISWWFGDGNTANGQTPQNTYLQPGTYIATVTTSEANCVLQKTIEIQVRYELGIIPELVTPNDDGKNDIFEIKGLEFYPNNELEIYNRWGNLVYSVKGYNNDWDGRPNAQFKTGTGRLPVGVYFYILKLNDADNRVFKGFFRLEY